MARNYVSRWEQAVLDDVTLKPSERLVALAMAKYATHSTGKKCHPGPKALQERTGLSERTVTRARKRLEALGWLSRYHTGGTEGTRTANAYNLTYPRHLDPGQIDTHVTGEADPGQDDRYPCHSDLPPTYDLRNDLPETQNFEACRSGVRLAKLRLIQGHEAAS